MDVMPGMRRRGVPCSPLLRRAGVRVSIPTIIVAALMPRQIYTADERHPTVDHRAFLMQ